MNLDELMQSIAADYPHPYAETYRIGFDHGVERVGKAINEVLGKDALAKVLEHIKQKPERAKAQGEE